MERKSEEEIRREKLEKIQKEGINPYPAKSKRTHTILKFLDNYTKLEEDKKKVTLCGRIMTWREHGKLIFATIEDDTLKTQLVFSKDELGDEKFKWLKNFDIADFIQATGTAFTTQKGEKSLLITDYKMLCKALLPLPEKWAGLKDEEVIYRKRYLDLIMNPKSRETFKLRSKFVDEMHRFMYKNNFLEVETPILENIPGGAEAEPFVTHHNALDIDLYLRISLELPLKKLIVGNLGSVYELSKVFRNEGMDREHLQEITLMEFYWQYHDVKQLMKFVEKFYATVIERTFGTLEIDYQGKKLNFKPPYERVDYIKEAKKETGIDLAKIDTADKLKTAIKKNNLELEYEETDGLGRITDLLYKKFVRPKITGPAFLINQPVSVSPLAKKNEKKPLLTERMQVLVAGSEVGNGFSELNDPVDQKERFEEQAKLREAGDSEAHMMDMDFIEALEHGMPPTAGFGVGIDRLFMILTGAESIRDVVLFPTMKPKHGQSIVTKTVESKEDIIFDIPREKSLALLKKHVTKEPNLLHNRETEVVMRGLAKKLGYNEDLWGATGLLHDIDWEETENKPEEHAVKGAEYLKEAGYPEDMINAISAHNCTYNGQNKPNSALDYALRAGETVTGLIYAAALVRPDKKLESVKVKSIKKKMKDKSFAAKVNRDTIRECENLGLTVDEFLEISLNSMQNISDEIGL